MRQRESDKFKILEINEKPVLWLLPYFLSGLFILLCYCFFYEMGLSQDGIQIKIIMAFAIVVTVIISLLLAYFNRLNFKNLLVMIIIIGLIMRIGYMLYTPYNIRQHDLGEIGTAGHLDYIYTIATTWRLPTGYDQQFYHPPLYHFISAIFYKIATLFYNDNTFAFNAIRMVSCLASAFTLILSYKIFKNLKFSKHATLLSIGIVSIHPAFIYLAGSNNNDMLSIFFAMLAILYLIKWYYNQNLKNIIIMALALGLGMMTKLSIVMIAPVIASVFIYVLIKRIKAKKTTDLLKQFVAFGLVSIPLGMWYSIRNLALFEQKIGYVLQLPANTNIYTGNYSFVQRFLSVPIQSFYRNIFPNVFTDYNVIIYTLKSSLFGEWTFKGYEMQATLFIILNAVLILISLICMIYVFAAGKDTKIRFSKWVFGIIWIVQLISFIQFNISYPFACTMDFRYIVMTVITGAAFIGLAYDIIKQKHNKYAKPTFIGFSIIILLFAINSVGFYVMI